MGKLIPTADEIKLLFALRRHRNDGRNVVLLDTASMKLWPVGEVEYFGQEPLVSKRQLDKITLKV